MGKIIGLIGGTGVCELLNQFRGSELKVTTIYGDVRTKEIAINDNKIFVLKRHGTGHKIPPHKVPYKAIASALESLKVDACFSTAAVGSLVHEWEPGTLVVCTDFIDLSARNLTMFESTVHHTDFADPFPAHPWLIKALEFQHRPYHQGVYANMNGPRYETPAEIKALSALGAQIVGMTAGSEATVMKEARVPYGCLAIVTNLASGLSPEQLAHEEVAAVMQEAGQTALHVILKAIDYVQPKV